MGNTACISASQVSSISDAELTRTREEDDTCLTLFQQRFPSGEVVKVTNLDSYRVIGAQTLVKTSAKPEVQELGMLCVQNNPDKLVEKYGELRAALQNEVKYLGSTEASAERLLKNSRLQILCRTYDALLREEERERRRVEQVVGEEKTKEKTVKEKLPPLAKAGLAFGIGLLMQVVEAVGAEKPQILIGAIDIAASVVIELKPLSLISPEPAINKSIDSISRFFEQLLSGSVPGLTKALELKAVTVMLGLALAKGKLTSALSLVQKFMSIPQGPEWTEALPTLAPMLSNLQGLGGKGQSFAWNWNPERQGPDIAVSNENLRITRTNSSGWGSQKSEQKVTDGVYYIEFLIERNSSSCLLIGVADSSVIDFTSKCSIGSVWCYQADGDTYVNSGSMGNIGNYTAGDRIGMLVNMDEHTLTFFKNGVKMSRDAFTGIPNEVQLMICFGGSDQYVVINNEPELPAELADVINCSSQKKTEAKSTSSFPIRAQEILQDDTFTCFTKSEGTATPSSAAIFVLAALDSLGEGIFGAYGLDNINPKYPKNRKMARSSGLAVDVKPETFRLIIEILHLLKSGMKSKNWTFLSFKQMVWGSLSALRLLRNHIFTTMRLHLSETDSGLTDAVKAEIKSILSFYSNIKLSELKLDSSPEHEIAENAVENQAVLLILHSFELFYPTFNSQISFVISGLASKDMDVEEKRLVTDVLKKVSLPASLIRGLDSPDEESSSLVRKFLFLILDIVTSDSMKMLDGGAEPNSDLMNTLYIVQGVLFAQIAKKECSLEASAQGKAYLEALFSNVYKLLTKLKEKTSGKVIEQDERIVRNSILGDHLINLLRVLCVLPFESEFSAFLIGEMTQLNGVLSEFSGGDPSQATGISLIPENYESEHPYPNSADQTHTVQIPGATYYTLVFDPQCKSETNYDYLELWTDSNKSSKLYRWDGDNWPKDPVVINQSKLFFTFHSDGSTNFWGWKIAITAAVGVNILQESWVDELRNGAAMLLTALCGNMIMRKTEPVDKEMNALLGNKLLKGGIKDTVIYRLLKSKPVLSPTLAQLIVSTQTDEKLPTSKVVTGLLKLSISRSLLPKRLGSKPVLSTYLPQLGLATAVESKFCDIPVIEALISGAEKPIAAFNDLKRRANLNGPLASLGGDDMDQAERAVFGVMIAFFELTNTFTALMEEPQDVGDMLKFIVKEVSQVRQWAQLQRQKLIDSSNRDVPYSELSKDIVDKCVVLLHTDYSQTLGEIGIEKVLSSLMATIKRTQTNSEVERKISLSSKMKAGSKWKDVKKNIESMGRIKTLQGLRVLRNKEAVEGHQEEDKTQFMKVYNLVLEVFGASVSTPKLAEELERRRNRATARCIGLNLLTLAFRSAPESTKGEIQGLISTGFADAFIVNNAKRHYTEGTEGVDPFLSSCLQRSFFQLYQLLLNRLQFSAIRDQDCTSDSVAQYILSTFDALSFPFDDQDAASLLELRVRESANFLLSWSKGQRFSEHAPKTFDRAKVIVDFKLHLEADYHASADHEAFSLHTKNRLDGEVAEDVEGQIKLVLEVIRGVAETEVKPIIDVMLAGPDAVLEGYTKIEGNVNEVGDPLFLFVKREEAKESGNYLTKVKVTGWAPVSFGYTYQSYASLVTTDTTSDEYKKRNVRKLALKRGAWLLFKLLMYSAAGRSEDHQSLARKNRRTKLQELFAELLYPELKCLPQQSESEDSLDLRKLFSGKNWRTSEIPLLELKTNPVAEWVEKIREDTNEFFLRATEAGFHPGLNDQSFSDQVHDYIAYTDPMMKGVLQDEDVPGGSSDLPAECRNDKKQLDFFRFMKYVVANADAIVSEFWVKYIKESHLIQNLPNDFSEAQQRLGEGSVASILSVFQATIHPNDQESFLSYLRWFSESDTPGILIGENAPKSAPKEFLNEDKNVDFFVTLRAIKEHPEQFPAYFTEVKQLLQTYDALPQSCSQFYKARLSPSQAEYQASLLLLLYQCCHSKGMLGVLAHPHILLELLKHMLIGSLKSSHIAFRIVREIVSTEHSPESFEGIWASLPKGKLRAEYGNDVSKDLISVLFCFIGIHSSIHIKSWKFTFLTLEKIEMLSQEALGFLHRLTNDERWRERIAMSCLELASEALTNIPSETGSEMLIGALVYLKSFDGRSDKSIREWNRIELRGAGVTHGTLLKHKKTERKLKLYCEGDDALHTEASDCFVSTLPVSLVKLFNKLSTRLVESVFGTLVKLITVLDDPIYNMRATTAESKLNNSAIRRMVQSSSLDVLATICDSTQELHISGIPEFAGSLIKSLGREPQIDLNHPLYRELQKLLYIRHRGKVASEVKSNATETFSAAAEAQVVSGYPEEKQILVATLKSIGLDFADIKDALDHGNMETDAVLKYIEQRNAAQRAKETIAPADNMLLYKLNRNEKNQPIFRDNSGKATYRESPRGHLCLQATKVASSEDLDESKCLFKQFDEGIFASLEQPPEELTLLSAVGFSDKVEECTFGFVIGKISLTLRVSKEKVEGGMAEKNYFFRAFLQFNGHAIVYNEATGEKVLESDDAFSFEDIATTKFGVFLNSFGKVELKGLAMFLGHFTGTPSFWEDETDAQPIPEETLIPYRPAPVNLTIRALISALGVPKSTAMQIGKKHPDLKRAISALLQEQYTREKLVTDFGTFVQDVAVVGQIGELPPGFQPAPIYFNQEQFSSDYTGYSGTVIGVKAASERGSVFLKGLEWKENQISVLREEKGVGAGIVSVLVLRVSNVLSVEVPPGYQIVSDGVNAINLTPNSGKVHFLVYRSSFSLRGQPFTDFSQMPKKTADSGLMDTLPQTIAAVPETDSKALAEDIIKYSTQSSVQLQTRVFAIEKTYRMHATFKLILKLLSRWSDCVQDVRQLSHLLECSGKKFALLKPAISAILERGDLAPILGNVLLVDVITQLIKPAFANSGPSALKTKTLVYESPHPYENNTDKTEEIRIPGAKSMILTFDPLCKSEANYDWLQFAKDKDFQSEICKYSGSSWPNFSHEGDTLYFKFHSDGSNNDWGYKFTVTTSVAVAEGGSSQDDFLRALWILESVVFDKSPLPSYFGKFLDPELQNALNLFVHTVPDPDVSLRTLFLLKKVLMTVPESTEDALSIVNLLGVETFALYKEESGKQEKSRLLKTAVGLLVELKDKYELEASGTWFQDFYETYSFLKGIQTKDENFQFLLLKQFLDLKGRSLDVSRESSHPYALGLTTKEVYSRGASFLNVSFTKESEAETDHGVLFSKDLAGTQPILIGAVKGNSAKEVFWSTNPAGPNIATSNNNRTVTRTDSSGWGTAILTESFSTGKIRLNYKIDSHDGGSYLYLGVWAVGSYNLSSCVYKDLDYFLWVYKVTGEFHRKGFSAEVAGSAFSIGDEVSIGLDFDEHTVTFFRNGEQKYQFTDLVGPVTGCACFGGNNQNISLLSVQSDDIDPLKLSEMKMLVQGERFFYHYPVNSGYINFLYANWRTDKNPALSFSGGNKEVRKAQGSSEQTIVYSANVVRGGRQFLEVKISDLENASNFSFGVGLIDQPNLAIAYQSDGVLKKFGESFVSESFGNGDSIGLLLNFQQSELKVFKNGVQVSVLSRVALETGKDFHWAVSLGASGTVTMVTDSSLVESLDLLGRSAPTGTGSKYGYKFTASPTYVGQSKRLAFENLGSLENDWKQYYNKQKNLFSTEVCEQLVNYVDEKCATSGKEPLAITPEDLSPTPQELLHYDLLEKLALEDTKGVFRFIKDLNQQVNSALPLISLDLKEGRGSLTELQKVFLALRGSLFFNKKKDTLRAFLSKTNSTERPTIEINRTRATRQKEKGMVDSQGVSSIFGQIFRLMNKSPNTSLRNEERIFQVNFTGEGSIDAGGPYNEVMSNICEELQSKYLPLLVQCPNGVQNLGDNRDGWIPNPASDSTLDLDLFLFLGKMFGIAIRTQNNLNLSLPPVFWKRLVFYEVGSTDVKGFDECIYQTIDILRHSEEHGMNADSFQSAFDGETFTTRDSAGRTVELVPGGKDLVVTFQNALQYADSLERQRLTEADVVYSAIRTGMSGIVPLNLLYMFSWKQVETLVCGAADIDVEVLKGNTIYEGLTDASPVVQMFWEVMKEMTSKERSLFLRFVWGRSRLPGGKQFKQFKITNKSVSGDPNKYLPVSHTCFFTLDMPGYTSKDTMREKLVYAITHCQAIDLDRVAGAEGWEDE